MISFFLLLFLHYYSLLLYLCLKEKDIQKAQEIDEKPARETNKDKKSCLNVYTGSSLGAFGEHLDIDNTAISENEEMKQYRSNEESWDEYCGNKYIGVRINGSKQGKGIMIYASGDIYEGEWNNGLWDGLGKLIHTNGSEYEGGFKYGKFHGRGVWTNTDGSLYQGQFFCDKIHG